MERVDKALIDPDVEPDAEKLHRVVRGAVGSLPLVGSAATEAFLSMFESPMNRRRTEWMLQVTTAVNQMVDGGVVTLDGLLENDRFVDVVLQASLIAQKTSKKIKLEALCNSIVNVASSRLSVVDKSSLFLRLIDSFDEWHIRVLHFYANPEAVFDVKEVADKKLNLIDMVQIAIPELKGEVSYVSSIWYDLKHAGLIHGESPTGFHLKHHVVDGQTIGVLAGMATAFGGEFLYFISNNEI
ncbi:hypothetical protein D9M70_308850 [compost metagenome]